jgi:ABC-type microcin C transport system permease subunit YejE
MPARIITLCFAVIDDQNVLRSATLRQERVRYMSRSSAPEIERCPITQHLLPVALVLVLTSPVSAGARGAWWYTRTSS